MTIDSSIRDKVIELYKNGKKRHEIVGELNLLGISISTGSVSNICSEWLKHKQSLQQPSPSSQSPPVPETNVLKQNLDFNNKSDRVTTSTTETTAERQFKTNKDVSIENHIIRPLPGQATQDFERNGYPIDLGQKGPLSWFVGPVVNGQDYNSEIESEAIQSKTDSSPANPASSKSLSFTTSQSAFVKTIAAQKELVAIEDVLEPEDLSPLQRPEELKSEVVESEPVLESNRTFPRPSTKIEDRFMGGMDWDSDDNHQRRFWLRVMDEKRERRQELQLIERRQQELEQRGLELQEKEQQIMQWSNDLKARESKLDEIKPLLPSVLELQSNGITFDTMMSYLLAINAKAALDNTDLKKAAYDMKEEFKEYQKIQDLRKVIKNTEQYLADMGNTIRQNERAILTIIKLRELGYTEKDIRDLIALVSAWHEGLPGLSCRKLDSELIDVGIKGGGNLQQSASISSQKSNNSVPDFYSRGNGNNGHGTMQDFIRQFMQKGVTSGPR